jgi:DNA-binding protein
MVAKKAEEVKGIKENKETKRMDDNVVFVGQKPTMSYVLAVITQFSGSLKEVHLKARGRSISRAVDVAEIVKNRFLGDVKVNSIDIGTEEREVEEGNKINVSTIDIRLLK